MPTPDDGGEWGVLGGSFDPVHNGHLNLAKSIYKKKDLSGVLFVPSFHHPLTGKEDNSPFEDRLAMLQLALVNYPEFSITQIEKSENLSGYTLDTLRALKKRYPDSNFSFIMGADLLTHLIRWHRSQELLIEFNFLAGGRPGVDKTALDDSLMKSVELIEIDERDISATAIREKVRNGASINDIKRMVPDKVAEYIFEKKLYK